MAKKKWWVKMVIGAVVLLSGWVLYISSKQIERNRRIEGEVSALQSEALNIRHENETLAEKISYFSSDDFREQEAKKKLGLKKAEETVVVIKPRPEGVVLGTSSEGSQSVTEKSVDKNMPNYKKWWGLFF